MLVTINLDDVTAADLITTYGSDCLLWLYSSDTETDPDLFTQAVSSALTAGTERYELNATGATPGVTRFAFRVENLIGSAFTEWSDTWLSDSLTAYASVDDVAATMSLPDESRYALIEDMIADVSTDLDSVCGRSFYRIPQVSGEETFYFHVGRYGMRELSLATIGGGCSDGEALDIISVTSLYVRTSETADYVLLTEGVDFLLVAGDGPGRAGTEWPYEDIALLLGGQFYVWPVGYLAVQVTGVRGFPKVPSPVKRAVISEVRNRFRLGTGTGGGAEPTDDTDWLRITFPPYCKVSYGSL